MMLIQTPLAVDLCTPVTVDTLLKLGERSATKPGALQTKMSKAGKGCRREQNIMMINFNSRFQGFGVLPHLK